MSLSEALRNWNKNAYRQHNTWYCTSGHARDEKPT